MTQIENSQNNNVRIKRTVQEDSKQARDSIQFKTPLGSLRGVDSGTISQSKLDRLIKPTKQTVPRNLGYKHAKYTPAHSTAPFKTDSTTRRIPPHKGTTKPASRPTSKTKLIKVQPSSATSKKNTSDTVKSKDINDKVGDKLHSENPNIVSDRLQAVTIASDQPGDSLPSTFIKKEKVHSMDVDQALNPPSKEPESDNKDKERFNLIKDGYVCKMNNFYTICAARR